MACDECRELTTHAFRSPEDLVHAIRLAAEEADRGVLRAEAARDLSSAEREALDSSLDSGALPGKVRYRFRCEVCGDRFTLSADVASGEGAWIRNDEEARDNQRKAR